MHRWWRKCPAGFGPALAVWMMVALIAFRTGAVAGEITACNEESLLAAIEAGGDSTFGCSGTISLSAPIAITGSISLTATGNVILVPSGNSRVFEVATNGTLTLNNLTLSGGRSTNGGGGAIFNRGSVLLISCTLSNHLASGLDGRDGRLGAGDVNGDDGQGGGAGQRTAGGAVFNLGTFQAVESGFYGNRATGGNGGLGGDGGEGEILGGDGGRGGSGGAASGGAIYNAGRVEIYRCGFYDNVVIGGDGADGGDGGDGAYPGIIGGGGRGGPGAGGAIYSTNKAVTLIVGSTFSANSVFSGASARGGTSKNSGKAGENGPAAYGGGICNLGTVTILNSTFHANEIQAGNGGTGDDALYRAGNGGAGGTAWGGNVYNAGTAGATNCTFYGGVARPGTNGLAGEGAYTGRNGDPGRSRGANIGSAKGKFGLSHNILANSPSTTAYTTNTTITRITNIIENVVGRTNADEVVCTRITTTRNDGLVLRNTLTCTTNEIEGTGLTNRVTITSTTNVTTSAIVDNRANAYGSFKDGGYNLLSDASIKFKKGSTSRTGIDPRLGALAENGGPTETMALEEGSPAIDGGAAEPLLDEDQRGVSRPFGEAGDIGAFESDVEIVVPPSIVTQPISRTVTAGSDVTFLVVAAGSAPLSYQWYRALDGPIDGEDGSVFTLQDVQPLDDDVFYVVVSNDSGSVTSAVATLTVTVQAPAAQTQPNDVVVYSGENLSFTFVASGSPAPAYQWYFNGTNLLAGQTASSLVLTNVQVGDAGTYHAIATNVVGSVTSRVATLTVSNSAPVFTIVPPASTNVVAGANAVVVAAVTGSQPLTLQWYFTPDGELGTNPLDGQTNATLTVTSFQAANVGVYTLIAENPFGTPDVQVRIDLAP